MLGKYLIVMMIGCLSFTTYAKTESLDRVVAVVNDTVITQSEVENNLKAAKQQLAMEHKPLPDNKTLRKQVLDRIVYDSLVLQIAKRNKAEVSKEDLNQALESMAASNHMDIDQMKFTLQNQGTNFDSFSKRIEKQILISRIQQQAVAPKIQVSEAEIDNYIKSETNKKLGSGEYHIIHIVAQLPESPTNEQIAAAKSSANTLYKKIKDGESFEKLAVNTSTGAEALAGGDLGWRKAAEIPTVFSKALASMKVGDVSKPLQAPNGFHILKLVEARNDSTKLTRQEVKNQLSRRKFDEHLVTWLQQLRDQSFVKITL